MGLWQSSLRQYLMEISEEELQDAELDVQAILVGPLLLTQ